MPAKITLKITEGKLKGKEFSFNERTSCIFGRSEDCKATETQLPEDDSSVSRHHCMLDINPPEATIRDFGSLNGTYLNDVKIGQRAAGTAPEDGQKEKFPEHDIKDEDRIKIGKSVFSVMIHKPCRCARCLKEIPEELSSKAERKPGLFQCDECFKKAEKSPEKIPLKKKMACKMCGKDISAEIGYSRVGDYVCKSCVNEPMKFIEMLLNMAKSGNKDLVAIDGYKVLRILGQGGMGIVYLAEREKTGEKIALKVMTPKIATDEKAKNDFLRETENTKALRHKNIVQLYDNGYSNATFFMTLDYCNGGSVDKLMLERGGTLGLEEACRIILDVLDGLEYAHQAEIPNVKLADGKYEKGRGLVHRDISPHNIFLMNSGVSYCAKLGDFGLAKSFDLAGLSGR
ncbi:MAG: protein kinase, partial [Victivallales bacterium]